jgi:effector-binding domain-containing protein
MGRPEHERVMLMPIGQFARASRLSIKSLRNYHESGLLPAAFVDPGSGYRYYRLEQLAEAIRIRSLRMVDLPLAQIKQIVDGADSESVLASHLATLLGYREDYDRKVRELTRLISQKELTMTNDVTIKFTAARTVAAYRTATTYQAVFEDIPSGFARVLTFLGKIDRGPVDAPFTIFHQFPEADAAGEISLCVPVGQAFESSSDVEALTVAGGPVSSIVHRGSYADMADSYATIAGWIHERGHRIVGPSREIYLNNPADVEETELLTEIQWPIDDDAAH